MSSFDDMNVVTLQGDAILPSHFYGSPGGRERIEAEKRLMCAVLEDGVRCFERNLKDHLVQGRRAFREAEYWLFKERNVGPFSFEKVRDALGLSPDCVRRAVWSRRTRLLDDTLKGLPRRSPVMSGRKDGSRLRSPITGIGNRREIVGHREWI